MKKIVLLVMGCLMLQGFSYANQIPIFEDTTENQVYRVEVATSSLHAVHCTLVRIQQLAHSDPDKAADLCFNAIKYLMNAESCLYTWSDVK